MTDEVVAVKPHLLSTPKRKRPETFTGDVNNKNNNTPGVSPNKHISFSFQVTGTEDTEPKDTEPKDGSTSPRSKIAHRFRSLDIEGSDGMTTGSSSSSLEQEMMAANTTVAGDQAESAARKRQRLPAHVSSPETDPQVDVQPRTETPDPSLVVMTTDNNSNHAVPRPMTDPVPLTRTGIRRPFLQRSLPSINRTTDQIKPRHKKRAGTPPLAAVSFPSGLVDQASLSAYDPRTSAGSLGSAFDEDLDDDSIAGAAQIIDPLRAALTWHDDEITVYDPDDEDDDGIGINGIGFMPTRAMAERLTAKRRKQLDEYDRQLAEYNRQSRKEAREERRKVNIGGVIKITTTGGGPGAGVTPMSAAASEAERARRVRFTEEPASQGLVLSG